MSRHHEKLLVGVLAGIIIAGAAAFAIEPSLGSRPLKPSISPAPLTLVLTNRA